MANVNFMMVTVAACDPSFVQQALEHVQGMAAELRDKAGAVSTRYGVLSTGSRAGSLILFQTYEKLDGIDKAFKVYAESSDYQALMTSGKLSVSMRNIVKMEAIQLAHPEPQASTYGVVTRWRSANSMVETLKELVPVFEQNGAVVMRYGTLMTGEHAGKRLLGMGYRSMDSIEKTYDALLKNKAYTSALSEIELDLRNIVRFAG